MDEAQAGIKISRRNINSFICANDGTLMAESEEELKSLLMKVKEDSEKAGLKLNMPKMKIMASSPITSWQIYGETMETVTDYFLVLQNHKAMVFPVVMYGCESWTIKKTEHRRINAFGLWCWRRLLRVPWTPRRSNQSIVKEISPEYSLEGLRLKVQYFDHLMWRADSLEKTLMLGQIEGRRRRRQQRKRWLNMITDTMDMSLSKPQELVWTWKPDLPQSKELQKAGHSGVTEINWICLN